MNPNTENSYGKSIFQVNVNMMPSVSRSRAAIIRTEQQMERKMDRLVIIVRGLRPQRMSNRYGKKNA
jgi:hypothetical protein